MKKRLKWHYVTVIAFGTLGGLLLLINNRFGSIIPSYPPPMNSSRSNFEFPSKILPQSVEHSTSNHGVDSAVQTAINLRNKTIINPFNYKLSDTAQKELRLSDAATLEFNKILSNSLDIVKQLEKQYARIIVTDDGGQALEIPSFAQDGAKLRTQLYDNIAKFTSNSLANLITASFVSRDHHGRVIAPTMYGGFGEMTRRISLTDRAGQGSFVLEEIIDTSGKVTSSRELRCDDPETQRRYNHLLSMSESAIAETIEH